MGCYNEELDAAKAYDWVAIKTRGADAKINFPASDYQGADGNMVPNERLNSMVARHQQNIDSAKKTQLPAISSQSALRTPVTAGQQQQRQHKSTAMAAPSRLQSDTWDLAEQQEIDMSLLCGRSASEFMGSGVSEEQQVRRSCPQGTASCYYTVIFPTCHGLHSASSVLLNFWQDCKPIITYSCQHDKGQARCPCFMFVVCVSAGKQGCAVFF